MSCVLPFPETKAFPAADHPGMAKAKGQTYVDILGRKLKLVELDLTAGFGSGSGADSAGRKFFKWVSRTLYTMEPTTAATDRISGVSPKDLQNLVDGDLFLVVVFGRAYAVLGGSTDAAVAGQYLLPSTDADKGKANGGGTGYTEGVEDIISLTTEATTDDTELVIDIVKELV